MASADSATPLRVLVVRPTMGEGGADRVTHTLIHNLDRNLFKVSLALLKKEGPFLAKLPADVKVFELGSDRLWNAWWPLRRLLKRERPDILLSTSSGMNVVAALAAGRAREGRCRVVLSERGRLFRHDLGLKRRQLILAKRLLYPRADCVTTVSQGVATELIESLKLAPDLVRVVYSPLVDTELERLAEAPLDEPWLQGYPFILAAGRLVPEKDYSTLLRALAKLRERREVKLVILGDGPLRAALAAEAEELGLTDAVKLPGFDPNPFRYMSRCSIFALSSIFEGLPGVLIQAMACGAAVVATDCPSGPAEIVTDGVDGHLVPVQDPAALAERLLHLVDHPEERQDLGKRAKLRASRFSVDNVMANYERALLGDDR